MNSFIILYNPFVPVSHCDRIVSPVHHPRMKHNREQFSFFKNFRENDCGFRTVHSERESRDYRPLDDPLADRRHAVRLPAIIRVPGEGGVFLSTTHEFTESHLLRRAYSWKHYRNKIIRPYRLSTRVHSLLCLTTCENSFYKLFVQRIFKNINHAEYHLLCIVLTCTGETRKSCRESMVQGVWVWNFRFRPYLPDHLAKLVCQFARSFIPVPEQGVCQERHVREALHGRVEIAGVAEVRQPFHRALKQTLY